MFEKLGVQLYTVRDFMQDAELIDLTFSKLARLGYTEVHTAGWNVPIEQFAELLAKHGLKAIGTHYDFGIAMGNREKAIYDHKLLGTTNIGLGGIPKPARVDLGELKAFIKMFNSLAEEYGKLGYKLTYHNHDFEFRRIDGYKTTMDILYEELDPWNTTFVLDTCWVAAGGADVVEWMEKLEGRLDILHIKDFCLIYDPVRGKDDRTVTEVGHGNLCWDKIMTTAEKIGVKHYIVEQDFNFAGNAFKSLEMSAEFLKKYQK